MAKKNFKKDIMEISKISKHIPSLMETIHFSPEREREMYENEEEFETEEPETPINLPEKPMSSTPEIKTEMSLDGKEIVDQIRKMALKAMAELADNTENSYYSVLKKIWQMADKNPDEDKNKKVE